MKINLPVTDVEYVLTERDSVVSKTDLRGIITYINEDFLRISGFTQQELIGASHNIVRHPDMPSEAFEDMWRSLKAGRPWTGLVKNRCKNGDFYWVVANATPIHENNCLIGYMSVRSKPSYEQIRAASSAYKLFREGKAGNLKIQDGKVIKSTLLGKLNLSKKFNIKARLTFVLALLSILMLLIGGMGLLGMDKANEGLRTVYEDRTIPMKQIASIQKLLLTNRLLITASLSNPTPEVIQKNAVDVEQNIAEIDRVWVAYMNSSLTPEEKQLTEKFAGDKKRFIVEGLEPVITALRANDLALANTVVTRQIRPLYESVGEDIQRLMQLQTDIAKQEFDAAHSRYDSTRNIAVGLVVTGIALALWLGIALIRSITRPLDAAVGHFGQIAQGKYNNVIDIERQDEIGKVMEALKSMQIKLSFDTAESKRITDESLRIKVGLDSSTSAITISGTDTRLSHMTPAAKQLLASIGGPGFNVDSLYGNRLSSLFNNPEAAAKFDHAAQTGEDVDLFFHNHHLRLAARPILDENGVSLGRVTQWLDRTDEVAVEQEVAAIVEAAARGDFTRRIQVQDKEGFFKQLGESLNQLLQTSETGLNDVVRVLNALSRGDLTETITNDYAGTFGQLKDDANTTVENLRNIVNNIKDITNTINTGAKEIAAGNNDLSHRTEEQAASLEQTAASMEELTSTVQQNSLSAQQANQLAVGATNIAGQGVTVVNDVVATMEDINEASRKIEDIIAVIDSIAFQTNILALNAAVEAARAGEQGRGFAVVAVEVRNLAQRAAAAAGEIKGLIIDSVEKVEDGTQLVAQAGKTMEEIVSAIRGVTGMMSEITAASAEQSAGIGQVNQAISQMDDVTQQNAALVEQAAAAAESLEEQAQSLVLTVGSFKVDDHSIHNFFRPQEMLKTTNKSTPARTTSYKSSTSISPKPSSQPMDNSDWEEF